MFSNRLAQPPPHAQRKPRKAAREPEGLCLILEGSAVTAEALGGMLSLRRVGLGNRQPSLAEAFGVMFDKLLVTSDG